MGLKKAMFGLAALLTVSCGEESGEVIDKCEWPAGKYQYTQTLVQKECPDSLARDFSKSEEIDITDPKYLICGKYQQTLTLSNKNSMGCSIFETSLMIITNDSMSGNYFINLRCKEGSEGIKLLGKTECEDIYNVEIQPLFDRE